MPVVLVFVGGVAGGLARYLVVLGWPAAPHAFPWSTLAVNVSGAFALGLLLGRGRPGRVPHDAVRLLVGTGFLGAWTTFSALAVSAATLLRAGRPATAAAYVAVTVLAAPLAVRLATRLRVPTRPAP